MWIDSKRASACVTGARMRVGRAFTGAVGLSLLAGACGSEVSAPPLSVPDAGPSPLCPAGPNSPTAALTNLPSGACAPNGGSCNYEGTPCPSVKNGTVQGYTCECASGAWTCEIVNENGLCSPLPDGGDETDSSLFPDVGAADAAPTGSTGPTGPTGPAQP